MEPNAIVFRSANTTDGFKNNITYTAIPEERVIFMVMYAPVL